MIIATVEIAAMAMVAVVRMIRITAPTFMAMATIRRLTTRTMSRADGSVGDKDDNDRGQR